MLQLERKMNALEAQPVADEMARITADWEYPLGKPSEEAIERVDPPVHGDGGDLQRETV